MNARPSFEATPNPNDGAVLRAVLVAVAALAMLALPCRADLYPFTEEAIDRGLSYVMQSPLPPGLSGAGCGFADLDNDGDPDIIILGGVNGAIGLFENDGTGHFTSRTNGSGLPVAANAPGFAAADYDGDGLVDIYITRMGQPNHLMHNLGDFHFADTAAYAGVDENGPTMGASWGDFNGDGWLDLYVCNYKNAIPNTSGATNKLYRNNGDGTFSDASAAQAVNVSAYSFQSVWFDYDRDGDLDLYLSNDRGHLPPFFQANRLWRNDGGTLVDVSASSGAGVALFSMGLACGDFDGNLWPDIYVTNLTGYPQGFNRLLLNQGNGTFLESAAATGVAHWITSWGAIFWDFDNDGFTDLYVNNQFVANSLYRNPGVFPCVRVGASLNVGGNSGPSYSSAVADVDRDGDLDLLLNNLGNNVQLFINHHAEHDQRWAELKVAGMAPNLHGVGANVQVRTGGHWQLREVLAGGNGYLGQNDTLVHFGIGAAATIDEVKVSWPGGQPIRTLSNLPTNQRWTLYPPPLLGDIDGNSLVDAVDFIAFQACYNQPIQPGFEMMDFDGNSTINYSDFEQFVFHCTEPPIDCDNNGQADFQDILLNPARDANHNGVLDVCENPPVTGDITGDGLVNVADLLAVINAWGPCPPAASCPADLTGNGTINAADLLVVINNWT